MNNSINQYDYELENHQIECRYHREFVGGLWDTIGIYQLQLLIKYGLKPNMKLVDIGCGCLRGGIHIIRYLNIGNYFGMDGNESLLKAGYYKELKDVNLQYKLPIINLLQDKEFMLIRFGVKFNYAVAFSLFSHLTLNHIRVCMARLSDVVHDGGYLLASYFKCTSDYPWDPLEVVNEKGVATWGHKDPYHYSLNDLRWCINKLPWEIIELDDADHPRGQALLLFKRII